MAIVKMFQKITNPYGRKRKIKIESTLYVYVLLSTFLLGSFDVVVEGNPPKSGHVQYVVVIDAGSQGSRFNAYKFHISQSNGQFILDEEFFHPVNPGLSSYQEPQKAAESIKNLLEANTFVPKELWSSTPLVLKATAGLRMLPSNLADNILNAVRHVISQSGFLITENAVEIMDGVDEGIFSWFTVNILLGKLDCVNLGKDTVATIDLGGGSTQVTFDVKNPNSVPSLANSIHTISTSEAEMNVFSNSYLNLGLKAARHVFFTSGKTTDTINYVSECINPIVKSTEFTYASKTYFMSGKNNSASTEMKPVVDLDACIDSIKQRVMPLVNPKPITLNEHEITAFSYIIHRAKISGIIPDWGGEPTVGEFFEKAKEVCNITMVDQPFLCFDLAYIFVLLSDGYGLSIDKKIILHNRIGRHRISWGLGCAYSLLADFSRKKK